MTIVKYIFPIAALLGAFSLAQGTKTIILRFGSFRKLFLTAATAVTCIGPITPSLVAKDTAKNAPVTPNVEKTIKSSYGYRKDNYCFIFARNFADELHKKHGIQSKIVSFFFAAWPLTGHVYVTYELNGERWVIDNEMAAPVRVTGETPGDWSAQLVDSSQEESFNRPRYRCSYQIRKRETIPQRVLQVYAV